VTRCCVIPPTTVLGPFYAGQQRELAAGESILLREETSDPLEMRGRVTDSQGRSIANALVEVWQTAPNQLYDVQDKDQPSGHLRASFRTDAAGTYRFPTIMPVSYPIPNDGPAGQLLAAMGRHPFRPALHDQRARISHPCHASLPGWGRVSGERCSFRGQAVSHHPSQADRGYQHGRIWLRTC
jgi:protocatechuate 3,4-dioxygenase beta subunit